MRVRTLAADCRCGCGVDGGRTFVTLIVDVTNTRGPRCADHSFQSVQLTKQLVGTHQLLLEEFVENGKKGTGLFLPRVVLPEVDGIAAFFWRWVSHLLTH